MFLDEARTLAVRLIAEFGLADSYQFAFRRVMSDNYNARRRQLEFPIRSDVADPSTTIRIPVS